MRLFQLTRNPGAKAITLNLNKFGLKAQPR
jgi:hypothetical protein